MRRIVTLASLPLVAAVLAVPATATAAPSQADRRESAVGPARPALAAGIIVRTRAGARTSAIRAAVADAVSDRGVDRVAMGAGMTALHTDTLMTLAEATSLAAEVARRSDVVWAEPNALAHPDLPSPTPVDDPLIGQLHNIWDPREATDPEVAAVGATPWPAGGYSSKAPALWRATRGNPALVLAVVDTGVRPTHPDLAAGMVPGIDMISSTAISNDGDGRDADSSDPGDWTTAGECFSDSAPSDSTWHGTHVAGTAAGRADNALGVAGVAPDVRIQPVRVLGRCGGTVADIAAGVTWAAGLPVAGLPDNPTPATVINLSLGGPGACSPAYQAAFDGARAAGATIVVSAGNDNSDVVDKQPANCDGVVVVGSISDYGDRASYSNHGSLVDVSAPGGDSFWDGTAILSTHNAGTTVPGADDYDQLQGTSMAAPAVSGAAALIASLGSFTPDQVEAALKTAVTAFPTSANADFLPCAVGLCGAGALDLGQVPAPVTPPAVSGAPVAGTTVTASPGTWTGPPVPLAYTWLVDGVPVAGGPSYPVTNSDVGTALSVRVAPAAGAFTPVTRESAAVVPVARTSTTTIKKAPRKASSGDTPTIKVRVKVAGLAKFGGRVKIYDGRRPIRTAELKRGDRGRLEVTLRRLAKPGRHKITARYSGTNGVAGSRSEKVTIRVVKR